MSDLFDKLNLLLRASLDNLRTNQPATSDRDYQDDASADTSPEALATRSIADLERQIATMRKQIDAALSSEDAMQARLIKLNDQVTAYDQAADAALERGDESEARRLVTQMQQQRRLATMVNAELEDHRSATSEFITRVNMLESTVSDAKRARGDEPTDPAAKTGVNISPELAEIGKATATALNDVMRTLREHAEAAITTMTPRQDEQPATSQPPAAATPTNGVPAIKQETPIPTADDAPAVPIKVKTNPMPNQPAAPAASAPVSGSPISEKEVEDDLARRRSRLS